MRSIYLLFRRKEDERVVAEYFQSRDVFLNHKVGSIKRLVAFMRMQLLLRRYPCRYIPSSKSISPFTAPHGLHGVFISSGASIGGGCTIFQGVTIGSITTEGSSHQGAPTIGSNCVIGAGAKIIGGITVGDSCRIGANCVVCEDVPPNSTVVLEKARVITRTNRLSNTHSSWGHFGTKED